MVRIVLSLRFVLLLASAGALLGAVMMFWLAYVKLAAGIGVLWISGAEAAGEITAAVMRATDSFLFGLVLVIFAYAIAFGFVIPLTATIRLRLPNWMQVESVNELKRTLIEVILVYLVVDFATDVAAGEGGLGWPTLVKPVSILLIAATLRLMTAPGHR